MPNIPVPEPLGSGSADSVVASVRETVRETTAVVSAARKIPLELLCPSPFNSRRFRTQERIQEVAQLLRAHGQQEPLRVYPGTGDCQGKFMIVSGVTRFLAAKNIGWTSLEAWIDTNLTDDDPISLISISHLHNDTSAETDIDHAAILAELEDKGYTQEAIMMALGYSSTRTVRRLKAFKSLPQAIYDFAALNPHKITATFAEALRAASSALGEQATLSLAEELVSENLTLDKLLRRIRVEERRQTKGQIRAKTMRDTTIYFGKVKAGELRIMHQPNDERKKITLQAFPPENMAEDVYAALQNLVSKWKE